MLTDKQIERFEEIGNRWTKGTHDRIYFNATDFGLVYDCYKTGNVSSAAVDGERISNAACRRILFVKSYVDVVGGNLVLGGENVSEYSGIASRINDAYSKIMGDRKDGDQ